MIWSVALFLIAVLALPIAFAQTFTGSRMYFVLVNAAIISVVLFILQSFLVPNKPDKEKVSMWLIVIIIALLISWFYGSTNYIWKGPLAIFFSYYILVNSIIIAAALYFIFGLLKVNEKLGGSKEGQIGYGLLLFIISLLFAVKLGNQWIWSQPTISSLISYFFGEYGILTANQNRIFIFIGTAVLFAVFFDYVGLGKENRKLNYMLAIIFAANLVSGPDPYQYEDIKPMIIIIGTWILGGNLSERFSGKFKTEGGFDIGFILAYIVALLLMLWAVSSVETAVTPEGKAAVAKNGGGVTGWIWGFLSMFFSNKGFMILGLIILLLIFSIFRAENRKRIWDLAVGGGAKRLNAMFKRLKLRRPVPEGREEQVIKENRHIINANVAYTTRSEITFRYWAVVKEAVAAGQEVMPIISKFHDLIALRKDIILYRSGDGTQKTSEGEFVKGWNWYNRKVIELLNEYAELTARTYMAADNRLKPVQKFKPEAVALEELETHVRDIIREMTEAHHKYKERTKAYASHHVLRAFKGVVLTMSNVTGDILEHPQIFARPDAEFIGNDNKEPGDNNEYYGNGFKAGSTTIERIRVPVHEVTQYGELVDDINKQKDMLGNLPPLHSPQYKKPRRLKNMKDIIDYPHFIKLMKNIELDWRGLAYDIRWGIYHPKSRTALSYLEALKENKYPEWRDEDIHFINAPSTGDPALDLRALAFPGKNEYWGREKFDDLEPPPKNPFPIVSSGGLRTFLKERIEGDMRDKQKAHQAMRRIPADTMAFEKVIEKIGGKKVVTQPIGGYLSDEPVGQQKS